MEEVEYLIVGAGVSGLAMGQVLYSLKKDFFIIEKQTKLGGVWNSTVYQGLGAHTPSFMYRYLSKPWGVDTFHHTNNILNLTEEQPTKQHIIKYLTDYSEKFKDRIKFDNTVSEIIYDQDKGFYDVSVISKSNIKTRFRCKYIIANLGNKFNAGTKRLPKIDSSISSKCKIFHSSDFDELVSCKEKKILVVGTGKSAQDLLVSFKSNRIDDVTVAYDAALWSMYYEKLPSLDNNKKLKFAFIFKAIFGWNFLTKNLIRKLIKEFMVNPFDSNVDPDNWNLSIIKKKHAKILRSFKTKRIDRHAKHKLLENGVSIGDHKFIADIVIYATGYEGISADNIFPIFIRNGDNLYKYEIKKLYAGTVCLDLPTLFIPCARSGLPSSVQAEIDALWIMSFILGNKIKINKNDYVTSFPYNFDPRSAIKKILTYKKMRNKFFNDIADSKIFELHIEKEMQMYKYLKAMKSQSLYSVIWKN